MFESCCTNCFYYILLSLGIYFIGKWIYRRRQQDTFANAKSSPKDVVTVHCFPSSTTIPNPSPFVLKLLTFLRAANIPYEIDNKIPYGPNGKSPWITLNGQIYVDSEVIVNHLSKKYNNNLNEGFKDEELAIARTVRVMLEERWFWCMPLWRFVWPQPPLYKAVFQKKTYDNYKFGQRYKNRAMLNGINQFEKPQVISFMLDDMRAVSKILGDKQFLLGSKPCQDDCAVFGQLAQALWALVDSPYEKFMHNEGSNLKEYCFRMKERFWKDWDASLLH